MKILKFAPAARFTGLNDFYLKEDMIDYIKGRIAELNPSEMTLREFDTLRK